MSNFLASNELTILNNFVYQPSEIYLSFVMDYMSLPKDDEPPFIVGYGLGRFLTHTYNPK
jgi:hypothetical protein